MVIGVVALGGGEAEFSGNFESTGDTGPFLAILAGANLAFYALISFEDSVDIAEETRHPSPARRYSVAATSRAAATVASSSSSVCARLTKIAS